MATRTEIAAFTRKQDKNTCIDARHLIASKRKAIKDPVRSEEYRQAILVLNQIQAEIETAERAIEV